jgi:hypothetical protein
MIWPELGWMTIPATGILVVRSLCQIQGPEREIDILVFRLSYRSEGIRGCVVLFLSNMEAGSNSGERSVRV